MIRAALRRLAFAVEISALLYIAAGSVGAFLVYRAGLFRGKGAEQMFNILGVIAMPAIASLLFIAVSLVTPGLLGTLRLRNPLPFTLPCVFSALQYTVVHLFLMSESQVVLLPTSIRTSQVWKSAGVIGLAWVIEVAVLCAAMLLSRNDRPAPS